MRPSNATLGTLIVAALALVMGGVLWLRSTPGVAYFADLPQAHGLREGATVRFRGVGVGRVERLAFTDSGVRVTLVLTRSDVPLRRGSALRIAPEGLFGDLAAELLPAPDAGAPLLVPGAFIPPLPLDSLALRQRAMAESTVRNIARGILAGPTATDTSRRSAPARR